MSVSESRWLIKNKHEPRRGSRRAEMNQDGS